MKLQMHNHGSRIIGWPLLITILLILPVALVLILPAQTPFVWLVFWFSLLACFNLFMVWLMVRRNATAIESAAEQIHVLTEQDLPSAVQDVMNINVALEEDGVQVFRGNLKESPEVVYKKLKETVGNDRVPLLQQDPKMSAAIVILPKNEEKTKIVRPWLNWLLFALTFITTTWAGALHQGVNLLDDPLQFPLGLPYSIGLLGILGFHELGHYFTALHYKMRVTPPYFIPVPFALGTFGAFISMRSPPEDRRSLFDVAVAGPLAGLVLAIPALIIGLQTSRVLPESAEPSGMLLGGGAISSSILFTLIAKATLGAKIASDSLLELSPLAFAGWLGLLVTALNLLPIGQLDGGHIAQAMFGTRGGMAISKTAMWSLFLLAIFFWPGLLFWAFIVFFIARRSSPPLNDLTPVNPGRQWLGAFSFFLLAIILIPMPEAFWTLTK